LVLTLGCGDDGGATSETDASSGTAGSTGGSADSTGDPDDPCGNGVIDGFEPCDDGNDVNGDGCNNDCTASGQVRWAVSFDGGAGVDCAEGVAADSQGNVIAAGFVTTAMAGEDLWIQKLSAADGTAVWTGGGDEAFGDDRYRAPPDRWSAWRCRSGARRTADSRPARTSGSSRHAWRCTTARTRRCVSGS
jgi:cysteine-rich repeat protein